MQRPYAGIVNRQLGYVVQPQNCFPAPAPFDALRNTISPSHFGQNLRVSHTSMRFH